MRTPDNMVVVGTEYITMHVISVPTESYAKVRGIIVKTILLTYIIFNACQ